MKMVLLFNNAQAEEAKQLRLELEKCRNALSQARASRCLSLPALLFQV